ESATPQSSDSSASTKSSDSSISSKSSDSSADIGDSAAAADSKASSPAKGERSVDQVRKDKKKGLARARAATRQRDQSVRPPEAVGSMGSKNDATSGPNPTDGTPQHSGTSSTSNTPPPSDTTHKCT